MKQHLSVLILMATITALPQSGEVDPTFGVNGKVVTGFGANQNSANAIALQPDGKFLAGGTYIGSNNKNDFALARYNSDGTMDSGFGVNGKAVLNFPEFNSNSNYIHSIYVLDNGKIVVFGTISPGGSGGLTAAIVRYNANGTIDTGFGTNGKLVSELVCYGRNGTKLIFLADGTFIFTSSKSLGGSLTSIGIEKYTADGVSDTAFGTNGQVFTSFGNGTNNPCSIALKPDGKFVIAAGYYAANIGLIAIAQYNPDGTLDTSFDTDGKVTTSFGAGPGGYPMQLSILPDGKIKIAGVISNTAGSNFALVQYNANGSLDTSFDGDGKASTPLPQTGFLTAQINSVTQQPDGKYLLVLNAYTINFEISRYNGDASLDTAFGTAGNISTTIEAGLNEAQSAAVLPDGKIIVVGKSQPLDFNYIEFAIARYDSTGALDASFAGDGKLTTAFEKNDDLSRHLLIQPDDRIIAIGTSSCLEQNNLFSKNIVLSRYDSNGSLDPAFGNAGKTVSAFGQNLNQVTAAVLQADGKILLGNAYSFYAQAGSFPELIRYNADGSLDAGFGSDGKVSLNYYAESIASLPDGKFIVGGGNPGGFFMGRFNSNGTLDTSFGTGGSLPLSFGQQASGAVTVIAQPDHKIVFLAGTYDANLGIGTFAAARFNADGSVDSGFGNNGQILTTVGSTSYPLTGMLQPDGKIVVAGTSNGTYFSAVRYLADGALDTTYGTAGIATTNLYIDSYFQVNSVLLQSDGKSLLTLAQPGQDANSCDFKIKRINPDGTFDDDFGGQNGMTAPFYNGYDEAFPIALQSDDKIVVGGVAHNGISNDFALRRLTNVILGAAHFNEDDASGLVVYPNPVKQDLYIKATRADGPEVTGYGIYNMLGQLVCKNSGTDLKINVANLSKGIYNIRIITNKGVVDKKFVRE
jgi:uncharacterized delta-60 repeat protein